MISSSATPEITRVTPAGVVTEFSLPDPAAGPFGITADNNGDLWFTELASGKIVELILNGPSSAATQTVISINPSPGVFGKPVTLTASVTSVGGTPTGTVNFFDGSAVLGSVTLDANGQAKLTVLLAAGGHDLSAQYVGNGTFAPSTSTTISEPVNPAPTVTAIRASANPVLVGQSGNHTIKAVYSGDECLTPAPHRSSKPSRNRGLGGSDDVKCFRYP